MSLKNIVTKISASIIALYMVLGNFSIAGIGLAEVIAEDIQTPQITIEQSIQKYVQYSRGEYQGAVVQTSVKISEVCSQETYLPLRNINLEIKAPTINGILPTRVNVITSKTMLTNGQENGKTNQSYDSTTGLLNVSYENQADKDGNIYSEYKENAKDEFEIIYIYSKEAYVESAAKYELEQTVKAKVEYKSENGTLKVEKQSIIKQEETENVGDIADYSVTYASEIYKGYMYTNESNKTNYATDYKTISTLSVINSEIINKVNLELGKSKYTYTSNEGEKELSTDTIVYKSSKISEDDFNKLFGKDGVVNFYIGQTKYASIKYTQPDKDGNRIYTTEYYTEEKKNTEAGKVEYPEGTTNITIETTKPQTEGKITVENQKQIISKNNYGKEVSQIKAVKEIRTIKTTKVDIIEQEVKDESGNVVYDENGNVQKEQIEKTTIINQKENSGKISLKEPTTQMSLELSNNNLSTLTTNNITATIKLNDTNNSCKLFESGNIEISLPKNVTSAKIKNAKSLYENGIKITNAKIENGKVILTVEGKQTTYDTENISGGVNIVIDLELNISYTTASHTETIKMTYNNNSVSTDVNIVSKNGLLMLSKTTGYDNQNNTITNMDSSVKEIQIASSEGAKEIVQTVTLVNNYDNNLTQMQVIGRIGYSNSNISSTFETNFTKAISLNNKKAKVYYSQNPNATYNDNSWTDKYSSTAKAYKIVLDNNCLNQKENIQISIYAQIPKNVGYNQATYLRTEVNYTYNGESKNDSSTIGMLTQKQELSKYSEQSQQQLFTETNQSANITLTITPIITENYVHAGQIVTYKIKVRNNSNEDLSNITLEDIIPNNAIYTYKEEKQGNIADYVEIVKDANIRTKIWKISSLKAGDEQEFEIMLTMLEDITQEQEIMNKVNLKYNEQTISTESKLTLKPAIITASLTTREEKWVDINYSNGSVIEYYVKVANISNRTIRNAKIQYQIPQNLKYKEGGLGSYNEFEGYSISEQGILNDSIFEYNVEKLEAGEEKTIIIRCQVERLQNTYEASIDSIANVCVDEDVYQSNLKNIKTIQSAYKISLQSNRKESEILNKGDEVIYTVVVKNIGKRSGGFNIQDNIPDAIQVKKIEYSTDNGTVTTIETSKQNIELTNSLGEGETLTINIIGTVKEINSDNKETVSAVNIATLLTGSYEIKSNEITLKVKTEIAKEEPEAPENPDNPDNPEIPETPDVPENPDVPDMPNNPETPEKPNTPDTPVVPDNPEQNTFTVSGLAWLDSNKNGKRDSEEKLLSGINVDLINAVTGEVLKNSEGNNITTTTGENGEYSFTGLEKGKYLVAFEFDTNTYTVTTYQKNGIDESLNSDVIVSNISLNGTSKLVGITDNLDVTSDLNNIDIGLIENANFDLSLDKQISKITVVNAQGTKTTEYNNKNFAKVDLVAKYMNNTSVIVTYKFVITNNGDVTGYVDMLEDNLPSGLAFSSELNKDWYKGSDGKLYTSSLSGIAISPGATSEVELILTKETTEETTGTFSNNAELTKISNLEAIEEKESAKENNKSSADIVISIKTGSPFIYIGITLVSIAVIAAGAYIIKKKVLDKEI